MKAFGRFIGVVTATLVAGSLAAQEPPAQTRPPQARMRIHEPGTGLQEGVTPRRGRLGMRGGMGAGVGMYSPSGLLAQKDFLGLSDDQISQLSTLETEFAEQRAKEQEGVRARQQELREEWNADDPDPQIVRQRMKAAMDAQQGLELSRIDAGARAKGTLNPEQLGKMRGLALGYRMGQGRRDGARGYEGRPGVRGPQGGRGMIRGYRQPVPPRPIR
jgi:hypothetical protein